MSFNIVAVNENNEPYNSNDILNTPKYVNINEDVYFTYITDEFTETDDKKFVWDFDYESTSLVSEQICQEIYNMTEPLSVSYYNEGLKSVNLKVYEKVYYPKILNSIGSIPLSGIKTFLDYNKHNDTFYVTTSSSTYYVDATNNSYKTLSDEIFTSVYITTFGTYFGNKYSDIVFYDQDNNYVKRYTIDVPSFKYITKISRWTNGYIVQNIYGVIAMCDINFNVITTYDTNYVKIIHNDTENLNYITLEDGKIFVYQNNNFILQNTLNITSNIRHVVLYNDVKILYTANEIVIVDKLSYNEITRIAAKGTANDRTTSKIAVKDNYLYYIDSSTYYDYHYNTYVTKSVINKYDLSTYTIVKTYSFSTDNNDYKQYVIDQLFYDIENDCLVTSISEHSLTYNTDKTFIRFFDDNLNTIKDYDFNYETFYLTQKNNNVIFYKNTFTFFNYKTKKDLTIFEYNNKIADSSISFNVFKFPTEITGLEYALENQTVTYSTNSTFTAESYIWKVDNVFKSSESSFNYEFGDKAKIKITCIVRNGYSQTELTFYTSLSLGSTVVGNVYENNIKDKLLFFNKEGDNLNFEYVEDENGLMYWKGDMLFNHNSSDTFKTIGLYTLEQVEPFSYQDEKIYTRKVQFFNEKGISFHKGLEDICYIESIEPVSYTSDYYTKWLNSPNIHTLFKKGDEVILKDFYSLVIADNLLIESNLIDELNSYKEEDVLLFTIIDIRKNGILIISDSDNKTFTDNFNYQYGSYRLQNNSISNIPQASIKLNNFIKLYDVEYSNSEWNEPYITSMIYDRKKLSIVNSNNNDSVVTVNFENDNDSIHYRKKIKKVYSIDIENLIIDPIYGFRLKLTNRKNKILVSSSSLVNFLPRSFNAYLNQKNILIWDKSPNLLTKNTVFSFVVDSNADMFNYLYKTLENDVCSNILTYNSTNDSCISLSINSTNISTISFSIGKTSYILYEGTNWNNGYSITDANASLFEALQNINEISVLKNDNDILVYSVKEFSISNDYLTLKNPMDINNPKYGIVNNKIIELNTSNYDSYIHYNKNNDTYFIFYFIDDNARWYAIDSDKKIVIADPTDDFNFIENVMCDVYLEDNEIFLTQIGEDISKESLVEKFITKNEKTLQHYDILLKLINKKLLLESLYPIESLEYSKTYIDIEFQNYIGTLERPDYVANTSGVVEFIEVDYISTLETLNDEKNYTESVNFLRKITIKDIDNENGLTLYINGFEFNVPFVNLSIPNISLEEENINDIDQTLKEWGNQRYSIQNTTKPYHQILEEIGVLVYLESYNSYGKYDTIVIESKYPNIEIDYSIKGTNIAHKIHHSVVEFYDKGSVFVVTINDINYSIVTGTLSIESIISTWVDKYYSTLLEYDIIVESESNLLKFYTLEENTTLKYKIWLGKNNLYSIEYKRLGCESVIISGNEIRNSLIDLQSVGFSTGMIFSLSNSLYPLNNQEYNLLFVDPNVLGLSYQGAFWEETQQLNSIETRRLFDWGIYDSYVEVIDANFDDALTEYIDIYNETGHIITQTIYNPATSTIWLGGNNIIIIINANDINDRRIIDFTNTVDPLSFDKMIYNPINECVYIISRSRSHVKIFDKEGEFITSVYVITPVDLDVDLNNGVVYIVSEYGCSVYILDLNHNIINNIQGFNYPIKIKYDTINQNMIILNKNNNKQKITVLSTITKNIVWSVLLSYNFVSIYSYIIIDDINNDYIFYNTGNGFIRLNTRTFEKNEVILPNSREMLLVNNKIYLSLYSEIYIYDAYSLEQIDIITDIICGKMIYVPFTENVFVYSPGTSNPKITVLNAIDNTKSYTLTAFSSSSYYGMIIADVNVYLYTVNKLNKYNLDTETTENEYLKLNVREFLRYPRERLDGSEPIKFKFSWEDNTLEGDIENSMFFYDFSGEQLFITNNKGKRILDKGMFNYQGVTPLLDENNQGFLNREYNTLFDDIYNPVKQQTIFDELYYDLVLVDSEENIDSNPTPIQTFIGYHSNTEGYHKRNLIIERLENVEYTIETTDNKNIVYFENNVLYVKNTMLDFIKIGFRKGQTIQLSKIFTTDETLPFLNAGLIAIIEKVTIDKLVLKPLNKDMVSEVSLGYLTSNTPPYNALESMFSIKIETLPETVAKITLKGSTEIEDERFKTLLNNIGYNINYRDIYIFDDYDINEGGIDYVYLNEKRKEMLLMYPNIYNYLGSYKAVINAINYFGYDDLEFYEYYLNVDKKSKSYNKYHKIEIPDIFNNQIEGWSENDYIKMTLPNKTYKKTNLFNLTYRITDKEGNYLLAYSPNEIITKLLGLKKWLRENIMPIGTRLRDITGKGESETSIVINNNAKMCRKFPITESLNPVTFTVEAYRQPVDNNTPVYTIHLEFAVSGDMPEYYQVKIVTYKTLSDGKIRQVQKLSYYKTDLDSINFTVTGDEDYLIIEANSDNNYGLGYTFKNNFSLYDLL